MGCAPSAAVAPHEVARNSSAPGSITIGTRIQANWKNRGKYYRGKITACNANGTFNILYDDSDVEKNVPRNRIQVLGTSAAPSKTGTASAAPSNTETSNKATCSAPPTCATSISSHAVESGTGSNSLAAPIVSTPPKASSGPPKLADGTLIEANWKNKGNYFGGKITVCNANGTFNILYDDKMTENNVPRDRIRVKPMSNEEETGADELLAFVTDVAITYNLQPEQAVKTANALKSAGIMNTKAMGIIFMLLQKSLGENWTTDASDLSYDNVNLLELHGSCVEYVSLGLTPMSHELPQPCDDAPYVAQALREELDKNATSSSLMGHLVQREAVSETVELRQWKLGSQLTTTRRIFLNSDGYIQDRKGTMGVSHTASYFRIKHHPTDIQRKSSYGTTEFIFINAETKEKIVYSGVKNSKEVWDFIERKLFKLNFPR